ncbi:MAG TPA: hypothetical protein EYP19_14975, partial [Desulfobacterales bacterium]|nr:hypothetical protein [Desulfobacterales bacterium]
GDFLLYIRRNSFMSCTIKKEKRSLSDRAPAFDFYKFRTMKPGAGLEQSRMAHLNESNGALFKIRDDPRITEVGRILRKHIPLLKRYSLTNWGKMSGEGF